MKTNNNSHNVRYFFKKALECILSIGFSISAMLYLDKDISRIKIIIFVLIASVVIFIWIDHFSIKSKKQTICSFIYSLLYSIALFIGKSINNSDTIKPIFESVESVVKFIFCVVCFALVITTIVEFILNKIIIHGKSNYKYSYKTILVVWLLIFVSWIPCYISYYPGILCYDIIWQTEQALGQKPYTQWQTPTHTFFWQICIEIGRFVSINPAVIYSVIQMLVFSYSMATFVCLLIKRKSSKALIIGSTCFFALNPTFAIFSFLFSKDVLSSAFFLLAIVRGIEVYQNGNCKALFVIDLVLSSLFRHNVFYATLLFFIIVLIIGYIKYKEVLKLTVISLIVLFVINGPIFSILSIKKDNVQESLSVPMQQIAMYVCRHEQDLNKEQFELINNTIPFYYINGDHAQFNPRHSDYMKFVFNTEYYENNKNKFWKVWSELFATHPSAFIDAFLCLNLQYWYQDATLPDPNTEGGRYISDWINGDLKIDDFDFERKGLLPNINSFYSMFSECKLQPSLPFIPDIFSLSLPVWLIGLALLKSIVDCNDNSIWTILPICLWITLLAAPVSLTRYILTLFLTYPLMITLIVQPSSTTKR